MADKEDGMTQEDREWAARKIARDLESLGGKTPEQTLERAHLAVVDVVVEHLGECPPAVREAVKLWQAAGEALVREQRRPW